MLRGTLGMVAQKFLQDASSVICTGTKVVMLKILQLFFGQKLDFVLP